MSSTLAAQTDHSRWRVGGWGGAREGGSPASTASRKGEIGWGPVLLTAGRATTLRGRGVLSPNSLYETRWLALMSILVHCFALDKHK